MQEDLSSRIRGFGRAGLDFLIEAVFPATCAGCGCAGSWMCDRCSIQLDAIDLLDSAQIQRAGINSHPVYARFAYLEPVRSAIHLLKYHGQSARAAWFSEQIEPLVASLDSANAILEPVPLTARRERARGFNQSREIARHLSALTGFRLGNDVHRVRETRPQVELNGLERIANVRGAFSATHEVAGKHVILVDDVITTGATMRECAAACFGAGAVVVVGVAVASGLD